MTNGDQLPAKRVEAEAKILVTAGYAVVLTPPLLVVLSFVASAMGFELKIDPAVLKYCVWSAGAIITYLFGRVVVKIPKFWGKK